MLHHFSLKLGSFGNRIYLTSPFNRSDVLLIFYHKDTRIFIIDREGNFANFLIIHLFLERVIRAGELIVKCCMHPYISFISGLFSFFIQQYLVRVQFIELMVDCVNHLLKFLFIHEVLPSNVHMSQFAEITLQLLNCVDHYLSDGIMSCTSDIFNQKAASAAETKTYIESSAFLPEHLSHFS